MNLWKSGQLDILWLWGGMLLTSYAWDCFQ